MLLSYVGVFTAVTPAVVGTTFSGCLSRVVDLTSPRPRTAPHEASPPFPQSLLSIARGTARLDAPRMRRRPGTFRAREFSYRRLSAAGLRIAGCSARLGRSQKGGLPSCRGGDFSGSRPSTRAQGRGSLVAAPPNRGWEWT